MTTSVVYDFAAGDFRLSRKVPRPVPGEGELLVRVTHCGLNPVDAKISQWQGMIAEAEWQKHRDAGKDSCFVPGLDVVGIVEEYGPGVGGAGSGVPPIGSKVVYHGRMLEPHGGLSEFAVHDAATTLAVPQDWSNVLSDEAIAAIPCAAWTAYKIVHRKCYVENGDSVLVYGATGGVGSFAVQFCAKAGAKVIIGICSAKNMAYAKELGCTHVIDYGNPMGGSIQAAVIAITNNLGVDKAIDLVGEDTAAVCADLLAFDGILCPAVSNANPSRTNDQFGRGICFAQVSLGAAHRAGAHAQAALVKLASEATAKIVNYGMNVPVSSVISLEETPDALRKMITAHNKGKVVVRVGQVAIAEYAAPELRQTSTLPRPDPSNIVVPRPFETICGHGLIEELKDIVAPPALIVTMKDLWEDHGLEERYGFKALDKATRDQYTVHYVTSLENTDLDAVASHMMRADGPGLPISVVGLGGGQAMAVAKYFYWKLDRPNYLFQCPTALTVDAAWGHRAAIRYAGVVRYVGFATPTAVYVDIGLIRKAPAALNLSGVGDVLCFHTAHFDWQLAANNGKAGKWSYDEGIVSQARQVLDTLLDSIDEVRLLSDKGVRALVEALSYGGAAFHAHGWNPRPVEGFDHIFFYALEKKTKQHFIHGYPVMLGIWLGSLLQGNDAAFVLDIIVRRLGIDVRPEAMKITWSDVRDTLLTLNVWSEANGYMYTIANHATITTEWIESARKKLYNAYEEREKRRQLQKDNAESKNQYRSSSNSLSPADRGELLVCSACDLIDSLCSCEGRRQFICKIVDAK